MIQDVPLYHVSSGFVKCSHIRIRQKFAGATGNSNPGVVSLTKLCYTIMYPNESETTMESFNYSDSDFFFLLGDDDGLWSGV